MPNLKSRSRSPRAPIGNHAKTNGFILLADVFSFGFILAAVVAAVGFDISFSVLQALSIVAIFGGMRFVAHDLQRSEDKKTLLQAQAISDLRKRSPARWSAEQRDGLGRRVDTGA